MIDKNQTITKLRANNPRQEETHGFHSWNLYRDGMTVGEYLAAPFERLPIRWGKRFHVFTGPKMYHLLWDLEHGYIELSSSQDDDRALTAAERQARQRDRRTAEAEEMQAALARIQTIATAVLEALTSSRP